jgi:enterochelin esterase-like enzyme
MTETTHRFSSRSLGNERSVWILDRAKKSKPCNLTIFLDGELYRDPIGAVAILDELNSKSRISDSLHVFVSHHEDPEARWKECPCHPPFAVFIIEELLPWLEENYPEIRSSKERVLIGLSYTGLAATYIALRAGGKFTRVISQSGSYWSNDCWLIGQVQEMSAPLPIEFYLDVGLDETAENVQHREDVRQVVSQLAATRTMRDALRAKGHKVKYLEFAGGHDTACWKQTLPDALRWALPP